MLRYLIKSDICREMPELSFVVVAGLGRIDQSDDLPD